MSSVASPEADAEDALEPSTATGGDETARVLWPDLLGVARGKYIPLRDLAKPLSMAAAMYFTGHDVEPSELPGYSADRGFPDAIVVPEPKTLRPGWNESEHVALGSSYTEEGGPFELDPRHVLRRTVELCKRELDLTPRVAMELEFFVLEPDDRGGWRAPSLPGARPYGTGPDVDPHGVVGRVVEAARSCGIDLNGVLVEFYAGQFEVICRPRDALAASDEVFLFRLLVREVVHQMGLKATFMPRPFNDRGGNGLHVNMSFCDDGGRNALHSPDEPDGLDPLGRRMVGGLLEHHFDMTAMLAPTVNSYKRLRPDLMCGYYADWGYDNRFVTIRVPRGRGETTRLEARQADASACPHLAVATLLAAALDGVRRSLEPPPARGGEAIVESAGRVPASLAEALDALDDADWLKEALGDKLVQALLLIKRREWERFARHVTDWELDEYLPHY